MAMSWGGKPQVGTEGFEVAAGHPQQPSHVRDQLHLLVLLSPQFFQNPIRRRCLHRAGDLVEFLEAYLRIAVEVVIDAEHQAEGLLDPRLEPENRPILVKFECGFGDGHAHVGVLEPPRFHVLAGVVAAFDAGRREISRVHAWPNCEANLMLRLLVANDGVTSRSGLFQDITVSKIILL
ncbi:MAG: hypothetical protein E7Z69_07460 [Thermoplasmata archaeon]|nr:hypothetical protein [Thermoplasmata archaeon]